MVWMYIAGVFTGITVALPFGAWLGHRVYRHGGTVRARIIPVVDRRITRRDPREEGSNERRVNGNGNGNGHLPQSAEREPELQQGHV